VGHLSTKTMPKHFRNNFKITSKKARKLLFWPRKWPKLPSQRLKFWPKISIFWVIYKPLGLKKHPKLGLLRPTTMLKNFLNNSKTTLKKSRKRLFLTPKMVENDPWKRPKWANFWSKISILGVIYQHFELKYTQK